ncbi:MAG: TIGR00730 family Rossman fold protein [Corynebacterium sp.]|nr:TIGR00730 family Rossman fold protein [Corynebacterium sp.]
MLATLTFRPMTSSDIQLREEAENRNAVREERDPRLLGFVPARGDYGIVASNGSGIAGVAWASLQGALPEITVSVDPEFQGHGLGTRMLDSLITHAHTVRWPGLALKVADTNPARRLYARLGFEARPDGVMVMPLAPAIHAITVYCGSASGTRPEYVHGTREFARGLAELGVDIVYGGGNIGLMGELADAALAAGGEVIGVIPTSLVDREVAHQGLTELHVVDSMAERKARMEKLGDVFVALPGGIGTLEELFEVFTMQLLGPDCVPVVLYNIEGYWTPLIESLTRMSEEGFIPQKYIDALIVVDSVPELFEALDSWRAPGIKWS